MLELRDIRKRFGELVAVDGLSLRIQPGEVFGLLGPNGAGKTTTIGMAIGLIRPDSGTVSLVSAQGPLGEPTDPGVRRHLGVAPQSLALYDELSGEENLSFFARLYGLRGRALGERVGVVLDQVGLTPRKKDRVVGYSGGMKRRLNLAVAMLHDPPLLLLDEPTAGVDPQSRNNILELVARLKAAGRTILYTTHYMEEAQRLCDRIAIMDRGRLLAIGTVPELVAAHGGRSTINIERAGQVEQLASDDPVRTLHELLQGPGAGGVTGLRIEQPSLESVFLSLTGRSLRD
jgi:ABC-2 type transport system ATP-binding protein